MDLDDAARQYVVGMLSRFALGKGMVDLKTPLAFQWRKALEPEDRPEKLRRFRYLGDITLYSSGFFGEHLKKKGISKRYVASMGRRAYLCAQQLSGNRSTSSVYASLAVRFVPISMTLQDVCEVETVQGPQGVVKLYDRWRRSGSASALRKLRDHGLFPSTMFQGEPTNGSQGGDRQ